MPLWLMSNYYHPVIETPQANLVAGMRWCRLWAGTCVAARGRECGHFFQGCEKAVIVHPAEPGYFATLSAAIRKRV